MAQSSQTSVETRTEYAIHWDGGEVQGPVSEEFARDVLRDPDLGPSATLLTRELRVGEWTRVPQ